MTEPLNPVWRHVVTGSGPCDAEQMRLRAERLRDALLLILTADRIVSRKRALAMSAALAEVRRVLEGETP